MKNNFKDELIKLRRHFHQYPELGFTEFKTRDTIEKYLKDLGLKTKRMAKTGIIATLKCKSPGNVIAFRADMDALNIKEENTHSYVSRHDGIMHACGHDGHMAIVMGLAKYITENQGKFKGTFRFIFQPAEEGDGGAFPMIKEGCLDNPSVDYIFGLHLKTDLDVGKFSIVSGPIMAGICNFELEVIGKGGHAAGPHSTVDPIITSAAIINEAQTIVSRNIDPFDSAVVTFSTINGGVRTNVISDRVLMSGTIRAMRKEVMATVKDRLASISKKLCESFSASCSIKFFPGYIPLLNDKKLTEKVRQLAEKEFGSDNITEQRSMGGDDFAYYAEKIPACYIRIGARNIKKGIDHPNHHAMFDIDENSLVFGTELLIKVAANNF